ncbi:MAG TPA: UDP-glucose 4-epimerase GalE [Saprospiraceae bacterium]|nr:UDP-glucose 4-epimerase GalE [Saprospiraceae bacterium]
MSKGKVLLTGGLGYIGSHTMINLIEQGFEPVSLDNYINSLPEVLDYVKQVTGHKVKNEAIDLVDLASLQKYFSKNQTFIGVIHFAALKSVSDSVERPLTYFQNNVTGLIHLLLCMSEFGVKNLIFSSSCSVYGIPDKYPVHEDTPLKPAFSPYGRTKQMCEHIIEDSNEKLNLNSIVLRYFNPAGAHPSGMIGELPMNQAANLIPAITETAIGKREKLIVYGDDYDTRDGSCIRDFIHIMDLARAHTLALEFLLSSKRDPNVEVFNLGNGEGITVFEAIHSFERANGLKLQYEIGPRRPGDIPAIFADYEKAKVKLNWTPRYTLDDIMTSAWQWEKRRSSQL